MNHRFFKLLASSTAVVAVGMLPVNLLPLLVGSWVDDLGATSTRAGAIAATELGAMAVAAMVLSPRMKLLSRRRLALTAGVGALVIHLISAQIGHLDLLQAARLLAGLCEGALLVAASASIAGARDPERAFALIGISGGLVATLVIMGTPIAIVIGGTPAAFTTMAVLTGVGLPLYGWLPGSAETRERLASSGSGANLRGAGTALVVAGVFVAAGQAAVWSFSERIGESLSFAPETIGLILGGASLGGIGGAVVAAVLGRDRGRSGPIAIGYCGVFAAILLVTWTTAPSAFVVGQWVFACAYFFVSPFVMGLAAELDRHGRVASALSAGLLVGAGLGPALGGFVVETSSFAGLGGLAIAFVGASAILLVANPRLRTAVFRNPI